MLRISTFQIYNKGVEAILDKQSKVSETSLQLASGKRVLTPSDDPSAAVQSIELTTAKETLEQYQKNIVLAEGRLNFEESTLQQAGNVLQRVRELALQGANTSLTNEDRSFIAAELRQRLDELVDQTNARYANGEYVFAGYQSQTQPFASDGAGGFNYSGDGGQRFIQVSKTRQVAIADPGSVVFGDIPNGNGVFTTQDNQANTGTGVIDTGSVTDPTQWMPDTYTISFLTSNSYEVVRSSDAAVVASGTYSSGAAIEFSGIQTGISGAPSTGDSFTVSSSVPQDIFTPLQNLITTLETSVTDDASRVRMSNAINRVIVDLDQAMEGVLNTRAGVGARLNALESQTEINESAALSIQETLSSVQDLDYAEAISRLQLQLVGLEAAQKAYVQIQGLSLFNLLR